MLKMKDGCAGRLQNCKTPGERVRRVHGDPLPLPLWLAAPRSLYDRSRSTAAMAGPQLSDGRTVASLASTIRRHVLQHLQPPAPVSP